MSAVTNKPRSQAKPKPANDVLQTRMSKIHSALDEGHKKLYLAQQSVIGTDVGEPVEVLLTFVTENLLPEAIAPLQQTPLTREIIDAVYTGMFPTLAALQGVIALARGSVIERTVQEAHDLLDTANSAMDFTDMGDALPRFDASTTHVAAFEIDDDQEERTKIAFDANYGIAELAKALKAHYMREAHDDWPVYDGILGRIQQLSEVVFYAMRLGGTEESMTYPSNETLQRFLDGHLGLILRDA